MTFDSQMTAVCWELHFPSTVAYEYWATVYSLHYIVYLDIYIELKPHDMTEYVSLFGVARAKRRNVPVAAGDSTHAFTSNNTSLDWEQWQEPDRAEVVMASFACLDFTIISPKAPSAETEESRDGGSFKSRPRQAAVTSISLLIYICIYIAQQEMCKSFDAPCTHHRSTRSSNNSSSQEPSCLEFQQQKRLDF